MRNFFSIGLALAAVAGCTGGAPLQTISSTEGTTVVRSGVVTRVSAAKSADAPTRLELRYEDGGSATLEATTSEVFKAGDKVRVTRARGTERIERLDAR